MARKPIWENWLEPLRVKCGTGLSDYRVMSMTLLIVFTGLYLLFW